MATEVVAAAGTQLHGGKFWEKRRRDRLKDSYSKLARLLPNHDPSKLPSQNDILIKATTFISELRLSNLRLLSDAEDEKSKLVLQLQDEVNKLIVRVKQLMQLLRKAKIVIPAGPEIVALGKRPGEKSSTSDTENAKKTRQDCTANPTSDDSADDVIEITGIQNSKLADVPVSVPLRDSNINASGKLKKAKSPEKTSLQPNQAQPSVGTSAPGVAMQMPAVSTTTHVPLQIPLGTLSLPTFITIPQPCLTILPQHMNVTEKNSSQLILPKPLVTPSCPRVAISRLANTRPPKKKFKRNRKKKVQMTRTDAQNQTQESIVLLEIQEKETTTSTEADSQQNLAETSLLTTQKTNNLDSASSSAPPQIEVSAENSAAGLSGIPLASSSDNDVVPVNSSSLENSVSTAGGTGANEHNGPESELINQQSAVVTVTNVHGPTSRTEEKELESMDTSPQKVHQFMSDTFKDIEEILMPHNQKEHLPTDEAQSSVIQPHESAQNNTQQQPQEAEQLSSEKISECIARSMDLIDQSGPDLMDLSGDWPNTSSPKSPLSPTKMFLSMFPLALRENPPVGASSTPGPEVSSANSKITAAASSTAKSSFHIDSMLPAEEMSGRTSACNTPLPMGVPGMIGHQPTSLHSLSTDDYLSMVSNFVSGTGTKSSTFDQFSFGLTGDLEGTEASNPFSFSLNLPTFDAPGEQLAGGNKYIPDQGRSRPDKRFSTPFVPNILEASHQTATPTNFSFTLSNTASYAAAIPAPKSDTESKKKSTASRNTIATDSPLHVDQRHQLSAGASSRHVGHQANQRSAKHQSNPMQFTISDLMSTSPQQVSSSVPRQSSTSKTNQGIAKADTCQYKPYENPSSSSGAASQQIFSQPVNQPIASSHPQTYTNLLPSFSPKSILPNLPPSDPNSRQQKQPKSTKPTKSGDQSSRSQSGPLRSYRTLSDSVVDITRKSSETWSSSSYRYYDTGYSAGSAQPFAPNVAAGNSYNDASMNRHPVSQAVSSTRNSESTAPPKFQKAGDKQKSSNPKGAKASASSSRRASTQSNPQMQLPPPPMRHPENRNQNSQLLQLRPPAVSHNPSESFLDMGNGRNSFGFFESVPNRLQAAAGTDAVPLPQPIYQPADKPRISFDFVDKNINIMQNSFQQQHSAHEIKSKQMPSQSRQSSSKNFHLENTSNSTRNPTSTSSYSNQSQPSSSKKKSTEPATSNMHHPSPQPVQQQQQQHNQFHGSYNQNQSGNMWIYDQPKVPTMRNTSSQNQPPFQKSANAFSVSKLVGNVESQQPQQQPRHFVEGLLGKNTPTSSPWIMASGADAHHSTNAPDQGFGYYQQPEGQMEYFNYGPAYHQPSPQVSNNGQNFSNDQGNHQGHSGHIKSNSHPAVAHYPSYPTSNTQLQQQQQQHDQNRQNNEVQQFPRFQHHQPTKVDQHPAPTNQTSSHQQMQQQHHPGTSSVSNFNLSSIFPEVNQDVGNRPQQHQQHMNVQSHGNSHQRNTSGHFYR